MKELDYIEKMIFCINLEFIKKGAELDGLKEELKDLYETLFCIKCGIDYVLKGYIFTVIESDGNKELVSFVRTHFWNGKLEIQAIPIRKGKLLKTSRYYDFECNEFVYEKNCLVN
jgi:hypothetical protein